MDTHAINPKAKVIVPESWTPQDKGKFFEKLIADLLRKKGLKVTENLSFTGMQVDCLAEDKDTLQKYFIECKFHKDTIDADVIDRLLGKSQRKEVDVAYLYSTSDLASTARGILEEEREKDKKSPDRKPRLVFIGSEKIAQEYIDIKSINLPNITGIDQMGSLTLVIMPDDLIWVAEEIRDCQPYRAILFPTQEKNLNIDELSSKFSLQNLWQGLEILDGTKIKKKTNFPSNLNKEIEKEFICSIGVSESFEHYQRPCSPSHFVGRDNLREKLKKLLENVKDGKTDTRLICFSGRSGQGKSSLVVRLQQDLTEPFYQNNFSLYHVDVRSAKETLFVISAMRLALQNAVDKGFINLPNHKIVIESAEQPLFSSSSVQLAVENLRVNNKVLIVFFDQFEEILTKESLLGVYELFQRLAYEVDALKANIVLGFCWRTGIYMPDGHKAYHLWHNLENLRETFEIREFTPQESKQLLDDFDQYLRNNKKSLDRKLKKWLLESCPYFPWLLRKLCGDIYNRFLTDVAITPGRTVNIQELFDQDLERYINTSEQESCLKYIAKFAPVSMNEVVDKFGSNTIKMLEDNRLIIRTGINYTIYWDIFREYILENKVPTIPLSYRPRNSLYKALDIFSLISKEENKNIMVSELASKVTQTKENTLKNILLDLQGFGLVKTYENLIQLNPKLSTANNIDIADYLANQLNEHIVIQEIYREIQPGKLMTLWGFQGYIAQVYDLDKNKTTQDYASRMLSWFIFAGLLEKRQKNIIARPIGQGKQKGQLPDKDKDIEIPPLLKLLN